MTCSPQNSGRAGDAGGAERVLCLVPSGAVSWGAQGETTRNLCRAQRRLRCGCQVPGQDGSGVAGDGERCQLARTGHCSLANWKEENGHKDSQEIWYGEKLYTIIFIRYFFRQFFSTGFKDQFLRTPIPDHHTLQGDVSLTVIILDTFSVHLIHVLHLGSR